MGVRRMVYVNALVLLIPGRRLTMKILLVSLYTLSPHPYNHGFRQHGFGDTRDLD